ncbi:hypothetical protein [Oleiharenicola lentus]|uniref:hypothetical protein n=1 Tax=Oleiharenicola lentus TaxID=2508720 RepID=UPI003F660D79
MKAGVGIFLSLGCVVALAAQPAATSPGQKRSLSGTVLRGQIAELVRQDAEKISPKMPAPAAVDRDPVFNDQHQPMPEDVLQLDPFTITKKREIELPVIPRLTLENFFYGDGKIVQSRDGKFSLSAGPERLGVAAIKFNIKF